MTESTLTTVRLVRPKFLCLRPFPEQDGGFLVKHAYDLPIDSQKPLRVPFSSGQIADFIPAFSGLIVYSERQYSKG